METVKNNARIVYVLRDMLFNYLSYDGTKNGDKGKFVSSGLVFYG